jgi:quercetin dioxygenase-like cupin family protein
MPHSGEPPEVWHPVLAMTEGIEAMERKSATSVDAGELDVGGPSGAVWSLPHGGDLDANVVVLSPGASVAEHVNDEVDVLLITLAGSGRAEVDGDAHPLHAGVLVHVPKHTTRAIAAGDDAPLVYATVHRSRPGLGIGRTAPTSSRGRRPAAG